MSNKICKRNYGYARVSTHKQVEKGKSIENQIGKIQMYFQIHDISDYEIIVDRGFSAGSDDRPGYQRLMHLIKTKQVDKLVITEIDRISRDLADFLKLVEIMLDNGAELCGIIEELNIDTPTGRCLVNLKSVLGQFEREKDAERVINNQIYRTSNHEWVYGRIPFGWQKIKGTHYLEINENDHKVFMTVLQMIKDGLNQLEVTHYLNANAIGGRIWTKSAVQRLLTRTMNYGLFKNKYITVENFCPPLVSKEELDEVLKNITRRKKKAKHQYYFKDKVLCSECHQFCFVQPTIKKEKVYKYHYCRSCRNRILEEQIQKQITVDLDQIIEVFKDKECSKQSEKLNNLIRKKEELYRMMLADKVDLNVYNETMKQLQHDIDKTTNKLDKNKNISFTKLNELDSQQYKRLFNKSIEKIEVNLTTKKLVKLTLKQK